MTIILEGFSLRKLNNAVDRFALTHPRFGVPNLMRYVVLITAAVYLLDLFSKGAASAMLDFNMQLVLHGEVWRLVTWLITPEGGNPFWVLVGLFFYYSIGTSVEEYWGTAKFTLFYLCSASLMVVFAFVSLLWDKSPYISTGPFYNILFLAFATLYPTAMIRIQLILPIQAKWLAVLYVVLTVLSIFRFGFWYLLYVLPVWLVYAVFFWDGIAGLLTEFGFHVRHQNSRQTIQFKSAVRQQKKKEAERGYRHKCAVCGRTDTDFPDLEFRYCSRCVGYHCFCQDHIFNHEHFTQ